MITNRHDHESDHVYDGIVEHNNKLPLWWQLTLYGAVVFALVYWYGRRLGAIPTQRQVYALEVAAQRAAESEAARKRGTVDDVMLSTLAKDPNIVAHGKDLFSTMCAACHRTDGGGGIGPNLTDEYWIHGGRPSDIYKTINEGVGAKGMPTWGPQLGEERVESAVAFVLSIRNTHIPGGKTPQGDVVAQ